MEKTLNKKLVFAIVLFVLLVVGLIVTIISKQQVILEKAQQIFNLEGTKQTGETLAADEGSGEGTTIDTSGWDTTKVDIVMDTANVPVPVPKGYVASGADGEHTVNTGFVIYEGTDAVTTDNAWEQSKIRNQWVWVPVPDPSRIYTRNASTGKISAKLYTYSNSTAETNTGRTSGRSGGSEPGILTSYDNESYFARYNLQGMTREKFLENLQVEFEETIKSIEKYGGFYIGRYETGNVGTSYKKPVVQRMNTNIHTVTWYKSYTDLKNLGANSNVKSNLIWGCLWDETLQWLIDTGDKTYDQVAKDSQEWGNYSNVSFEYTTTSGGTTTKSGSTRIPTGSTERNKANNIYDLAGNVTEWTMEGNGSGSRRDRGGRYNHTGSYWPAGICNYNNPYSSGNGRRSACVLLS